MTEPKVRPLIRYFWQNKDSKTTGKLIIVAVAVICSHIIPFAEINPEARIGNVEALLEVNTKAIKYSFHANINARIDVDAMAGPESGNTIRKIIPILLQPSINYNDIDIQSNAY